MKRSRLNRGSGSAKKERLKHVAVSIPKDLPKELSGLWKMQYVPREIAIEKRLGRKAMAKYFKMTYVQKIRLLDELQRQGYFGD